MDVWTPTAFEWFYMHAFSIFVFAPVQRNWACFTWKSALEIRSSLLLLLPNAVSESVSVSVFAQDGIAAPGKAHTRSSPSQQPRQGCPCNSADVCLVEHRSFPKLESGMLAASFLPSSFLRVTTAVMLQPAHVQKVPQALKHLCPAKVQTRCDVFCACQSYARSFPSDCNMARTADILKSLQPKTVHSSAKQDSPSQTPPFAAGSLSLWE